MIDTFTKYVKLYPVKKATSEISVKKLDEFITQMGKPRKVLSDRDNRFTGKKWSNALKFTR